MLIVKLRISNLMKSYENSLNSLNGIKMSKVNVLLEVGSGIP